MLFAVKRWDLAYRFHSKVPLSPYRLTGFHRRPRPTPPQRWAPEIWPPRPNHILHRRLRLNGLTDQWRFWHAMHRDVLRKMACQKCASHATLTPILRCLCKNIVFTRVWLHWVIWIGIKKLVYYSCWTSNFSAYLLRSVQINDDLECYYVNYYTTKLLFDKELWELNTQIEIEQHGEWELADHSVRGCPGCRLRK